MPLNQYNQYERSQEFETSLKKWISQDLYSNMIGCTNKEYEKIIDLLLKIEYDFFEQYDVSNDNPNLTFEAKRDKIAEDMKRFAIPKILGKLYKLRNKGNKYNSNTVDQDWKKCEPNHEKIAKGIWKVWCEEGKHRPRAGIIYLYFNAQGFIEVLLTKYHKNGSISYGFPKGKMEEKENIWTCAAREGAEELGLDAGSIYDQIVNNTPIRKDVYDVDLKAFIKHYYFIIPVSDKNMFFTPNGTEIDGVEWHSFDTIPCCESCPAKQNSSIASNYFMVNCSDQYGRNSLVRDIVMYVDKIDGNQAASQKYDKIHQLCGLNRR